MKDSNAKRKIQPSREKVFFLKDSSARWYFARSFGHVLEGDLGSDFF